MAKILIVDDEAGIRLLVARALRLEGHEVLTADDGETALEVLVAAAGTIDAVLSDIRMPVMSGIELAHAIHAGFPELPVLLMTGYAEQREAADDLTRIIRGVVDKPFTLADIRRHMREILPDYTSEEPVRRMA
ncbi:response regulator [Aureimonas fodinaquatilis]|uniref:Response regulator n=1 Tax=Aureimonas fodinaquatilis TaxID=2565783 RepID=A0A5B0DTS6_9HYPH|nr:response regulator [Aureimonas fodinaquatilis]KAA0968589.1 response regulator [Aureimonas fodinaquatilis]